MKRMLALLLAVSFIFTACVSVIPEEVYEPYAPEPEITTSIGLNLAFHYFSKLEEIWDAENGEIWGVPLHAPVVIVCERTRDAVANRPDPRGVLQRVSVGGGAVYVGRYVDGHIGATAVNWLGIRWGMMPLGMIQDFLYGELAGGSASVLTVLAHEAFHAIQPELHGLRGFRPIEGADNENARIRFLQELNALVTALNSEGCERIEAISDALSIRRNRRGRFNTGRDENILELNEGLAVYTVDLRLMLEPDVINEAIGGWVKELANHGPFNVSIGFGYWSGALYALLLNELGADWKGYVDADTDLGYLLKNAAGITELRPIDEIDLNQYLPLADSE